MVGWFRWCFTALWHILGNFGRGQYLVPILSPVTDNCPSWISGRMRMVVEFFSWPNLDERMWPDRGWNQRPLDSQSDSLPTALGGPPVLHGTVIVWCSGYHIRCSGYHIRLARRRAWVQSSAETYFLLFLFRRNFLIFGVPILVPICGEYMWPDRNYQ